MASFTDKAPTFNPYVQQQPVDAMVKVGMAKQQQYDQNLQGIQQSLNKIGGLNIIRDVDKDYLNRQMDDVTNKLQGFAAGDFSNANLTRSVTGMISKIGNDETIQNAVISTQRYQNQLKVIQQEQEDGNASPDNLLHFQKQASPWLTGTEAGQSFNGQYVKHIDPLEYARELFDDIKPKNWSFDQIYKLDSNGKPIADKNGKPILSEHMTRLKKEGRMPEEVQAAINQVFSNPKINQQLMITGQYNYRGHSEEQLMQMKDVRLQKELTYFSDLVDGLEAQKAFADESQKKSIDQQIDNINDAKTKTVESYTTLTDPDDIRGLLYKDEVRNNYTKIFGSVQSWNEVMTSPAWTSKFKMIQEANDLNQWAQEQKYKQERDAVKDGQWLADYQIKVSKEARESAEDGEKNTITGGEKTVESNVFDPIVSHTLQLEAAQKNLSNTSDELVYNVLLSDKASEIDKLVRSGVSRSNAISQIIENKAAEQNLTKGQFLTKALKNIEKEANGTSRGDRDKKPLNRDLYKAYRDASLEAQFQNQINVAANNILSENLPDKLKGLAQNQNPVQLVGDDGNLYTVQPSEQLDLAIYTKAYKVGLIAKMFPTEAEKLLIAEGEEAKNRLITRGKSSLIQNAIVNLNEYSNSAPESWKRDKYRDWENVYNLYESLGEEYEDALSQKSEYLRSVMFKNPNTVNDIVTGDPERDKVTLASIKRMAGEFIANENNISPTMDAFYTAIKDVKDLKEISIGQKQMVGESGELIPAVVIYDSGKALEMPINTEQAATLSIDLDRYSSPEANRVLTQIALNAGTSATTNKSLVDVQTYIGDEAEFAFDADYFPGLNGSHANDYDAKMNIKKAGNLYYGFIYVSKVVDGVTYRTVEEVNPSTKIQTILDAAKMFVNPRTIDAATAPLLKKFPSKQ